MKTTERTMRCPSCGGLNPSEAQWCGQCLQRFAPPPPPPEADPPPPVAGTQAPPHPEVDPPVPVAEGPHDVYDPLFGPPPGEPPIAVDPAPEEGPGEVDDEGVRRGAFRVAAKGVFWTCSACDAENGLEAQVCSVCGTPFRELVREPEDEREPRDPGKAAAFSLVLPGAGHAYAGDWGQAIGRAFLSGWIALTALFSLLQKDSPGSFPVGLLFGLIAFALWGVAAHDAYRTASGAEHLAVIRGRRFLYVTLSLVGLLMVSLLVAGLGAKGS